MKKARNLRWSACICVALLISPALPAAVPVGSIALYSNGKVEKLLSVDGGGHLWEDDRKRRYLRSTNPVVPVLMRSNFLSGRGYRQVVVSGKPASISSLPPGTPVEFSVERTKTSGERTRRQWKCVRSEKSTARVLGIDRRIDRYSCERFTIHRKTWQPIVKEVKVFSYSPELGLVTKMKHTRGEKTRRWKLAKLIAPEKATYKRVSKQVRKLRAPKKSQDKK